MLPGTPTVSPCKVTLYEHCGSPKNGWTTLGIGNYRSNDLRSKGVRINGLTGMKIEGPGH